MSRIYNFKENINEEELKNIANILKEGGIVVFPTETVYGIGADATNDKAVEKIFKAKGRPQDNPLIVHISDYEMLKYVATNINNIEKKLMDKFWPGPLTIILKSNNKVADSVTAGLDTVGVRMPSNDIALKIIEASNRPIAAPSANVSGRPSGTKIEDIYSELKDRIDLFVDGGPTDIGIESTVVKVENNTAIILRPGKISLEDIQELGINAKLDKHIFADVKKNEKVESPGMKHRHYAPNTKTILIEYAEDKIMVDKVDKYINNNKNLNIAVVCFDEHAKYYQNKNIKIIKMGSIKDLLQISKNIFSILRYIDKLELDVCLIEGINKDHIGTAIENRLIRACEYNIL